MKTASRMSVLYPEGAYAVLAKAQKLERQGKRIIHFEIGQPDFDTPKNIIRAAVTALHTGKTRYTASLGIYPLRQAIARQISTTHQVETHAEQVAVTPSAKTAIFIAMASLIEPGDEVVYPDPGFPTYKTLIQFFGGIPKPMPLLEDRGFGLDIHALKKNISNRTKLIILNSPSNPTGAIIPYGDLRELVGLARQSSPWFISDEIYSRIIYTDEPYSSIYGFPKMKNRTILIDGFSKTYAMTGWRLGYLVVPESMIDKIDYLLTHSVGCPAAFTQEAGLAALNGSQKSVAVMVKEFQRRRDYIVSGLNKISGITCSMPNGAFYVFPNIRKFKKPSTYIADYLLEKGGVALLAGTDFGTYGEGYVRISYATSMKNLAEGLERMKKALSRI